MIILTVSDKRFGKNHIHFEAKDTNTLEVIKSGKCDSFVTTNKVYTELLKKHGDNNVLLLTR